MRRKITNSSSDRFELRRIARVCGVALALMCIPTAASAHLALERGSPAAGSIVTTTPAEIRLTFTEDVEALLANLSLTGPDGLVALAPLVSAPDSSTVLIGRIVGRLTSGSYTVTWRVAGADGHPVSGEYSFEIAPGAAGLVSDPTEDAADHGPAGPPAPGQASPPAEHHPATSPTVGTFDADSPLYAAIRWLTFAGLLGVIGAVAFRLVLGRILRAGEPMGKALLPTETGAARLGLWATGAVGIAAPLRLYAQSVALHGIDRALDPGLAEALLGRTLWGWGWSLQLFATLVAAAGFALVARRGPEVEPPVGARHGTSASATGWWIAAVGALALSFTPGLSGHAAAAGGLAPSAILVDGAHIVGAGGWLGSLLVLLLIGIPAALRLQGDESGPAVAALVNGFSPTALAFAGITVMTGLFTAWLHLGGLAELWGSDYGRTLLVKLALVAGVFAAGAYNWLRVRPTLGTEAGAEHLRRSATAELAFGTLVLVVTAALVATPPP